MILRNPQTRNYFCNFESKILIDLEDKFDVLVKTNTQNFSEVIEFWNKNNKDDLLLMLEARDAIRSVLVGRGFKIERFQAKEN